MFTSVARSEAGGTESWASMMRELRDLYWGGSAAEANRVDEKLSEMSGRWGAEDRKVGMW